MVLSQDLLEVGEHLRIRRERAKSERVGEHLCVRRVGHDRVRAGVAAVEAARRVPEELIHRRLPAREGGSAGRREGRVTDAVGEGELLGGPQRQKVEEGREGGVVELLEPKAVVRVHKKIGQAVAHGARDLPLRSRLGRRPELLHE